MIWLTWRHLRAQTTALYAGVLALAVVLAITGPRLARLPSATLYDSLTRADHRLFYTGIYVLAVVPAVVGAFWGAPLVARELEAGTHRLVWNQSITRTHWLAVKLGLIGLAVMAATGLASLAVTWWSGTIDQAAIDQFPRLSSPVFDARGIVPLGYSAFVFILGVTIGMLVRRALPAMAITLAVFVAVQVAMPMLVRPHLLPPTRATVEISESILDGFTRRVGGDGIRIEAKAPDAGGWLLSSQTLDPSGNAIESVPMADGQCAPQQGGISGCLAEITRLGYREQVTYHAPTRFWPFQWIETGIYLGFALVLAGFCFWWLRRRVS